MTTSPLSSSVYAVAVLGPASLDDVLSFFGLDIAKNLFALSWLDNYGMTAPGHPELFHFAGVHTGGCLVAVSLVITDRLALLDSVDEGASRFLADWYRKQDVRFEHVVSAREPVSAFWETYSQIGPPIRARLERKQCLYSLERSDWIQKVYPHRTDFETTAIRLARRSDLDSVFLASAKMHTEETLEDPLERDADHFRRHVEHRIESERTFIWTTEHHQLVFKADISAQSRFGAQISGVYTPRNMRGRGIATRGMFDICEALFDRGLPRITLYVNHENVAARKVYEKVGFEFHCDYETVFVAPPN